MRLSQEPERGGIFDPVQPGRALSDLGNGERFADRNSGRACYCYSLGTWFVWDGRRWRVDDSGTAQWLAKMTVRHIYIEAAQESDDAKRKELSGWARKSEAEYRIRAMLKCAQSELAVTQSAFDADPWAFNCLTGTIDLRTGDWRTHHPSDLITRLAPVEYDSYAVLPLWDRFLREVTDDDWELTAFLARCAGYSLTGSSIEEKLFFVHGPQAAGKSTFLEALKATMGDYATTADFETFLSRSFVGGPRPDIARLAGARMVASVEVAEGRRLAEGLVKILTGGDTITARFLYKGEFEFVPAFKLWLAANAAPRARHDDLALWRRILKLPFDKTVPKEKRDPNVKATLRDPTVAGPAILAWAIQGCLDWQAIGLQVPERVRRVTEAYRLEQEPLREFIVECCVLHPDAWTSAKDLRAAYQDWGAENGTGPKALVAGRKWGRGLRARGCHPHPQYVSKRKTRGWQGIGLSSESIEHIERIERPFSKSTLGISPRMDFTETGVPSVPSVLQGETVSLEGVDPVQF